MYQFCPISRKLSTRTIFECITYQNFKKKERKKMVIGGIRTSSVRAIYSKFRCFRCPIRRRQFRRFRPKRAKRSLICTLRSVKHFKDVQISAIGRIVCPQTQRNGPLRELGIAILCFFVYTQLVCTRTL